MVNLKLSRDDAELIIDCLTYIKFADKDFDDGQRIHAQLLNEEIKEHMKIK